MKKSKKLFTSESVTEGHPDKVCDQISDAVLDACIEQDPASRVACEAFASTNLIVVGGEITTKANLDIEKIVRNTLTEIGYTNKKWGIDARTCQILNFIKPQSSDIAMGVSKSGDEIGAGDQGIMSGFACRETRNLMPLAINLAHELTFRLAEARKNSEIPWLRPDGKSQVTLEYNNEKPKRVDTVIISTQHDPKVSHKQIVETVKDKIIKKVVPKNLLNENTKFFINPTGRFVIGGPQGDCGLTGRKIMVDTYGGYARHGGGAFSGKDPTKVDRSAAYMARFVARNLVAVGYADELEIQVSYAIGVTEPISISMETFGTERISCEKILKVIKENFDFRPKAIIEKLDLRRPIYRQIASYGHFGRSDLNLPWEQQVLHSIKTI